MDYGPAGFEELANVPRILGTALNRKEGVEGLIEFIESLHDDLKAVGSVVEDVEGFWGSVFRVSDVVFSF